MNRWNQEELDAYRPSTVGDSGKRIWIYPTAAKGAFTKRRTLVGWFLMMVYFAVPWIQWDGFILFRLHAIERKMSLLGNQYWPSDIPLFLPAVIGTVFLVFLVTAVWGRVWCGWACPQTVFLQFIFEPIDILIEGKAHIRKKRDLGPKNFDWAWRKVVKQSLYIIFSLAIANTFLAYFMGPHQILDFMSSSPALHPTAFGIMAFVFGFFYWVFGYFKEQACVMLCPYARFQSVLTDKSTLQVSYDFVRGENRAKMPARKKWEADHAFGGFGEQGPGDCVDCNQCVKVCPTGIDIRQGPQLECIGCTRCMDACDDIMDTWKKPKGLIRYASEEQIIDNKVKLMRPRVYVYSSIVLILFTVFASLILGRPKLQIDVQRLGRTPYVESGEQIINTFTLRIRNRATASTSLTFAVSSENYSHTLMGKTITLEPGQLFDVPVQFTMSKEYLSSGKQSDILEIQSDQDYEKDLTFVGPRTEF